MTGLELSLRRTIVWYGGLGLLTGRVVRSLALPPKYFRLILREIESMGVQSLGVALTAAIFTGMVFTIQSAVNMARFGAETYVGPVAALAILRELGPVLTAILVGGKVASGITAELGSMKVTEQIDALRTLGVNYVKRLVVPRVLASLVVFPLLTVLTDAVGVLGGMVIMFVERGADMYAYWNTMTYWVVPKDFLTGIGKSVFFGAVVTLIGCYNGLSTEGGTEGLGRATTATVVHVTMGVIVQGRDARRDGRQRLGEDGAPAAGRRPYPSRRGPDPRLRPRDRASLRGGPPAAPPSDGLRVPGCGALRLALRVRKRRVPVAGAHEPGGGRDPGTGRA
ncbi:MAG: transporter [Candidatus Rokuibacteriota bacterium]|nr:MAG: transporter [Candidatus Rokubacteria bacterium]